MQEEDDGYALEPLAFFPGSASFFELPAIDGMRTLFIGKLFLDFLWQPSNMHPILHAALTSHVEILRELAMEGVEGKLLHILRLNAQA